MLGLSRKTDYALVALAGLTAQGDGAGGALSARRIAERYELPVALLMSVLKRLHRAGIVESTRGSRGGYRLVPDPRQLTVSQVVEAIEGPVQLAACCQEDEADSPDGCLACRLEYHCPISGAIRRLNERIMTFLNQVTLEDLMQAEVDVPRGRVGVTAAPHEDRQA